MITLHAMTARVSGVEPSSRAARAMRPRSVDGGADAGISESGREETGELGSDKGSGRTIAQRTGPGRLAPEMTPVARLCYLASARLLTQRTKTQAKPGLWRSPLSGEHPAVLPALGAVAVLKHGLYCPPTPIHESGLPQSAS